MEIEDDGQPGCMTPIIPDSTRIDMVIEPTQGATSFYGGGQSAYGSMTPTMQGFSPSNCMQSPAYQSPIIGSGYGMAYGASPIYQNPMLGASPAYGIGLPTKSPLKPSNYSPVHGSTMSPMQQFHSPAYGTPHSRKYSFNLLILLF